MSQKLDNILKKIFIISFLSFFFFTCSNTNQEGPVIPVKKNKSIIENGAKYDGPEKYSFYLASIKHGGEDIDTEPPFGRYNRMSQIDFFKGALLVIILFQTSMHKRMLSLQRGDHTMFLEEQDQF